MIFFAYRIVIYLFLTTNSNELVSKTRIESERLCNSRQTHMTHVLYVSHRPTTPTNIKSHHRFLCPSINTINQTHGFFKYTFTTYTLFFSWLTWTSAKRDKLIGEFRSRLTGDSIPVDNLKILRSFLHTIRSASVQ